MIGFPDGMRLSMITRVMHLALGLGRSVLLFAALVLGCDPGPRAPLLRDELVYHNRSEGIRFMVPEGWRVQVRAEIPRGPMPQERILVEYVRYTAILAVMQFSAVDLPESEEVGGYLQRTNIRTKEYTTSTTESDVPAGDRKGVRILFVNQGAGPTKEVISIRRGPRVFFFTGLYARDDHRGRDAFRRAVESVVWER